MRSITSRRATMLSVLAAASGAAFLTPAAASAASTIGAPVFAPEPGCPNGILHAAIERSGKRVSFCIHPVPGERGPQWPS